MNSVLVIAMITIVLFILSILFCPKITFPLSISSRKSKNTNESEWTKKRKYEFKIYPFIPLCGAFGMLLCGKVSSEGIVRAFCADSSVNPIRILVLFLSMTVFSLILDQTGFFDYISGIVLQRSGNNQHRIFLSLYCVISALTVFTSNDIVILTFTPFLCHFCKAAKIDAIPYLIMEFVAANTWSLFLLIGNPTNIYICGAFEIGFAEYLTTMALPTAAVGLTSLTVMMVVFHKKLKGSVNTAVIISPINDRVLMWVSLSHLAGCVILLAVSQYIGVEMWLIALGMGVSSILCSAICLLVRKKSLVPVITAIRKIPYEIIPFIVGMFVIVLALEEHNFTYFLSEALSVDHSSFSYGILSFLSSNVLNNIPMSVLFSKILGFGGEAPQIYATIVGSNIGAFITPIGALAGIMWTNLLKENRVKLSTLKFVLYGMLIGVPSMLSALVVLELIL